MEVHVDHQDGHTDPEADPAFCGRDNAVGHAADLHRDVGDDTDHTDDRDHHFQGLGLIAVHNKVAGGCIAVLLAQQPQAVHNGGGKEAHEAGAHGADPISDTLSIQARTIAVEGKGAPDGQCNRGQQSNRAYASAGDQIVAGGAGGLRRDGRNTEHEDTVDDQRDDDTNRNKVHKIAFTPFTFELLSLTCVFH